MKDFFNRIFIFSRGAFICCMLLFCCMPEITGCSMISQEREDVIEFLREETAYYRIYRMKDGNEMFQILNADGDVFCRGIVAEVVKIVNNEDNGDIHVFFRSDDGKLYVRDYNTSQNYMSGTRVVPEDVLETIALP